MWRFGELRSDRLACVKPFHFLLAHQPNASQA
jgi:hypothetical protein